MSEDQNIQSPAVSTGENTPNTDEPRKIMPELRYNVLTNEWVIISPERSRRPLEFNSWQPPRPLPVHDPGCPFCPGNEKISDPETFRLPDGKGGWLTRVVYNKFPALHHELNPVPSGSILNLTIPGFGIHEVIIDSPNHNLTLTTMTHQAVNLLLQTYRERYKACEKDPRVVHIIIFKNQGEKAGSSLIHPHSQLIATPIISNQIDARIVTTRKYFEENKRCLICDMIQNELSQDKRIICQNDMFVAMQPHASLSSFHTWIMPLAHHPHFGCITDDAIDKLSTIIQHVVRAHEQLLHRPDYNLVVRSAPVGCPFNHYHWYISIIPRISKTAGFEIGSGIFINGSSPEENSQKLRKIVESFKNNVDLQQ